MLLVLVAACTSTPPTPSAVEPTQTPTITLAMTPAATVAAPPTASATARPPEATSSTIDANGFPTQILGMPVVSADHARSLTDEGKLIGRAIAVAGYWHEVINGGCTVSVLKNVLQQYTACASTFISASPDPAVDGFLAVIAPEANGDRLAAGEKAAGVPLVVVGHAGDVRKWQCYDPRACVAMFAVDQIAWINGADVGFAPADNYDGGIVVSDVPVEGRAAGEFDPRMNGAYSGGARFGRVAVGSADDNGSFATRAVLFGINGVVLSDQPGAPDPLYRPGRVVARGAFTGRGGRYEQQGDVRFGFGLKNGGSGTYGRKPADEGGSIVLDPGSYVVHAYLSANGSELGTLPSCAADVSIQPEGWIDLSVVFGADSCRISAHEVFP